MALQRTAGNQAVERLLASQGVQASLKVGLSNDRFEQQAEQVAAQVMQQSGPTDSLQLTTGQWPAANAKVLPSSPAQGAGFELNRQVENRLMASKGGGSPLPEKTRASMEGRFGMDFSQVRVHNGPAAVQTSRDINADAFTHANNIYFGQGQYRPETQGGQRLLAHELTHVVQQGSARPGQLQTKPSIQRLFGKKKKPSAAPSDQSLMETGKGPAGAYFIVKAAVKTGTKTRGTASMKELLSGGTGHSWLEISLGPAYPTLDALRDNAPDGDMIATAMGGKTASELRASGTTSVGFYPNIGNARVSKKTLAKQLFTNLPGHIVEPEQAHFAGQARGAKSFAITDSTDALMLLNFINAHRARPYNVYRYNCTDFVIRALKTIGRSVGVTSNSLGWTVPGLMYKQLYKQGELGDMSVQTTDLTNKPNKAGKVIDVKHLSKKANKRLKKKIRKAGPALRNREEMALQARVIANFDSPQSFMPLRSGGMMRPGQTFGVTGVIKNGYGEVVRPGGIAEVLLRDFEAHMGQPYPGAPSSKQPDTDNNAPQPQDDNQGGPRVDLDQALDGNPLPQQLELGPPPPTQLPPYPQLPMPGGHAQALQEQEGEDGVNQGEIKPSGLPKSGSVVKTIGSFTLTVQPRYGAGAARDVVIPPGTDIMVRELAGPGKIEIDGGPHGRGTATISDFVAALG